MSGTQRIVIITGISGAGCSTALRAFEDFHFITVGRLPVDLIPDYIKNKSTEVGGKIAILPEIKSQEAVANLLSQIKKSGRNNFNLVFLDATDDAIVKRYSETRRPHPDFAKPEDKTLIDAIKRERRSLVTIKEISDLVIDTTALTVHDLKRRISEWVELGYNSSNRLTINFVSFGYKNGTPSDCDLLIDVRFLPNPYFIEELKSKTGLDAAVSKWVLDNPDTQEFLNNYLNLLNFLVPRYTQEGKAYLNIGVGCTGGQHRSVTLVEKLADSINFAQCKITKYHRDIARIN
jgi:UPF0042 nucleotide-binding protein